MENETSNQDGAQAEKVSTLHQVTSLSKYLAMTLFIILPFLGGYIGYMYAPEKVVEVERVVEKEVIQEVQRNQSDRVEPFTTDTGIVLDGKVLNSYSVKDFIDSEESLQAFLGEIANTYALNEVFSMTGIYRTYEKSAWGETQQCHGLKLQSRPTNFWHLKTLLSTLGGNSVNQIEDKSLVINLPWNEMAEEDRIAISAGEQITLELSAREPVFSLVGPCHSGFEFVRVID